ncbi:DUF475 domain-containing protein [Limimaricola pyoseonensis]|uniref:Integral membrane protein, YkoY family n=1 Tax=Limimaricola pyoseonensis TaxID=521013 RepID=A0A1G7IX22_9RHOB|nr:DUF475 domain-containing protein [Limimaricola pyoseonensis]SDF17282.1 hypothetical protein SAMN04488567_3560 [Limimaricola pyoseonensis]
MRATIRQYFTWSFAVTAIGLVLAVWLGWREGGTAGALSFGVIAAVLAVLEISLSFDNAIVNANKLETMAPVWRRRFLTWGILIAVFGMRIVFPLAVVVVAAGVGPWEAVRLAAAEPQEYARIMEEAHLSITAFGGTFLMMVALSFFIDEEKEVDWIGGLERRLRRAAGVQGLQIGLVLVVLASFAAALPPAETGTFLFSAILGLLCFLAIDMLGNWLDAADAARGTAAAGGLGAFLYLEVLDASFSFDGVIGAFAVTKNLFLIAIGLGIGAMYVRSMTIMLVEKKTLAEFRYLEHGAFYSILVLSVLMFSQALVHVPELITGLLGAGLIGLALAASIRHNRAAQRARDAAGAAEEEAA